MADFDKKVKITVFSDRCNASTPAEHERTEFKTNGRFISKDGHVTLTYDDSELMDGNRSCVELSFDVSKPKTVTMLRRGDISTTMVFEEKCTHIGKYETPYMPFDLKIQTASVDNRLLAFGQLHLDYIMEVGGISSDRTKLSVFII